MRRVLIAACFLLALPGVAHARTITFGSDLSATPEIVEAHGADSAFWDPANPAPAGGQVVAVKVKGIVLPDPAGVIDPVPMIHFQTIHPNGDGTNTVELSSAAFYTPIGGDADTVSTYHPLNMCVHKGDYLDFNDIGGNEWHWGNYDGMPFLTFARVGGASTSFFSKDNGTNIGSRWAAASTTEGEQLLMQMKLATGPDATDVCPGGYAQHVYQGLDLRDGQTATLRTKLRQAKMRVTCPFETYGSCQGTVAGTAVFPDGEQLPLGQDAIDTQHGYSDSVELTLTKALVRRIQRAKEVDVRLVATTHDDPRHDSRVLAQRALSTADDDPVPVQSHVTSATITLRADKPLERRKRRRARARR